MTPEMLQSDLETLRDLGTKAAKARHHHDESTCRFHTDYMRRFIDARPSEYKRELRAAFDQAYKDEATIYMNAAFTEYWASLSRAGDPLRIPNPFSTSFYAGWEACLKHLEPESDMERARR